LVEQEAGGVDRHGDVLKTIKVQVHESLPSFEHVVDVGLARLDDARFGDLLSFGLDRDKAFVFLTDLKRLDLADVFFEVEHQDQGQVADDLLPGVKDAFARASHGDHPVVGLLRGKLDVDSRVGLDSFDFGHGFGVHEAGHVLDLDVAVDWDSLPDLAGEGLHQAESTFF